MSNKNTRIDFHNFLLETTGITNVYYQPPENLQMKYPAIIYRRSDIKNVHASNDVYLQGTTYEVTVVDKDPDSEIVTKVSNIATASFVRQFTSGNLNHSVFRIQYK